MLSSAAGSPLAKLRRGGAGRKQDSTKSPRTRARLDKKNKRQQADHAAKRQALAAKHAAAEGATHTQSHAALLESMGHAVKGTVLPATTKPTKLTALAELEPDASLEPPIVELEQLAGRASGECPVRASAG